MVKMAFYLHGCHSIAPDTQNMSRCSFGFHKDYINSVIRWIRPACKTRRARWIIHQELNLFSAMLGLTGVQTTYYRAADDILQPCRRLSRMKILIVVEDDTLLLQGLILAAQTEGYACDGVSTACRRAVTRSVKLQSDGAGFGAPDEDGLHF